LRPGQKFSVTAIPGRPESGDSISGEYVNPKPLPASTVKQLHPIVMNAEVSWKEPNWRIEREELQNLAVKLERRYNVKITVDDRLKTYRFSGTLKDESLEQVLTAVQLSSPIMFVVKGKEVSLLVDVKKMKQEI
jgi:hypothetical protein